MSNNTASRNVVLNKEGSDEIWRYDLMEEKWEKSEKIKLSFREYEILGLYASGLTINEIGGKVVHYSRYREIPS